MVCGNGRRIERFLSNDQRESLVPAAAVIPALKAYTRVVAVKKLVVGGRRQIEENRVFKGEVGEHRTSSQRRKRKISMRERIETIEDISIL